jgi:hypothetical protein
MRRLWWLPVLLTLSPTLLAQSSPVQVCPSDVLDTTVQATEGSDHSYTLVINQRNTSGQTCLVYNNPGGPGVSPNWGVKVCYYCEVGDQKPAAAQIPLAPGEFIHQTLNWKTVPVEGATHCVSPTEMSWNQFGEYQSYVLLFSRSFLKPICSPIVTTNFSTGQYRPDTVAGLAGSPMPFIRWSNGDDLSYSREHIPLRVTVEDPGHVLSLDEHSCPRLFVRVRDATPSRVSFSRTTRVEEVQLASCNLESPGGSAPRFIMDFDIGNALQFVPPTGDENKGEYAVGVSALAESKGRYLLVGTSDSLHLSMVDGRFIRRNWSAPIEGASISLTLDKDAYELTSDIPLHLALGNVDSHATFTSMDPYMDPPGLTLDLESSDGQPIPREFTGLWLTGHGFCHPFISGLVFPVELTLNELGFHPNRPGVYSIVATWTPFKNHCPGTLFNPAASKGAPPEHLTVRSFPVTFRLVPK